MRISDWSSDVCSSDLADLALTADLGPGNGRVELNEHADRAGGQQDIVHARAIRTRPEIPIVAQHGGDDARGAVGGCSDDPSACGVLLIHGDREQADMIHDRVWRLAIAEPVGVELLAKSPGAALHVEATRKHAFGDRKSTRLNSSH